MKPIDNFKDRLQKAITIKNIKPVELHEKTGISESLLSKYLSGNAVARQRKLTLLADALNINEVWLMGYDVPMERNFHNTTDELGNPVSPVPLLGSVKAGYDYMAQENWEGTINIEKNLVGDGSEYFALKVKGDSMAPAFLEGDIVVVHKQNDCENNEIAIVIVNGDEGTIKKVRKTDVGIMLQPLNPAYAPAMYSNEEIKTTPIIIAGVVKQLKREF